MITLTVGGFTTSADVYVPNHALPTLDSNVTAHSAVGSNQSVLAINKMNITNAVIL